MLNVVLQFLELDLVNINASAKFYQNISNGLRVKFHCSNFHHNSPPSSAIFRIWSSAKPRPMLNVISQSLGLELVNINVYATVYQSLKTINVILQFHELDLVNINVSAKFYQNIPNVLRVKFHCFQNLNFSKTSTNPK